MNDYKQYQSLRKFQGLQEELTHYRCDSLKFMDIKTLFDYYLALFSDKSDYLCRSVVMHDMVRCSRQGASYRTTMSQDVGKRPVLSDSLRSYKRGETSFSVRSLWCGWQRRRTHRSHLLTPNHDVLDTEWDHRLPPSLSRNFQ